MSAHVTRSCLLWAASLCLLAVSTAVPAQAPPPDPRGAWHEGRARDPGVRAAPSSEIPNPVPGLNQNEALLFIESLLRVSELEGTCDTCSQQPPNTLPIDPDPKNPLSPRALVNSAGMGPVFNADQCFICHSQPQIGGTSPRVNPANLIAHRLGGTNVVPAFDDPMGPSAKPGSSSGPMARATAACTACLPSPAALTRPSARCDNRTTRRKCSGATSPFAYRYSCLAWA